MSAAPLHVRRLRIERLYGIPHDGLEADDLASGVNVIFGPNGQGKTTFGRGLHALVWPESVRAHHPIVSGAFAIGDTEWRLQIDGGAVRHDRDGVPGDPPALPHADERPRYRLSLHELLASDGKAFSDAVARNAAGGMHLAAAQDEVGFSSATPRSTTETSEARDADKALREIKAAQAELHREQQRLGALREQQATAKQAQVEAEALALAAEHARAREAAASAAEALRALPEALARVRESDAEDVRTGRATAAQAETEAAEANRVMEQAEAALADNRVAQAATAPPLAELRTVQREVQEAAGKVAQAEVDIAGRSRQEEEALREVGGVLDAERLAGVTVQDVVGLDAYAQLVGRLDGLQHERKAAARILAEAQKQAGSDDEVARAERAISALRDWLRSGHTEALEPESAALWGAIVTGLLGAGLGALVHPAGFALLLPAALLVVLYLRSRQAEPTHDGAAEAEARYERAYADGLEWREEVVEARLDALERLVGRSAIVGEARSFAAAVDGKEDAAEVQEAEATGRALADRLGVEVRGVPLAYLVRAVQAYQRARSERLAAEGEREAATRQRTDALQRAATLLAPFGRPAPSDAAGLAEHIDALDTEAREADQARRDRNDAESRRDRALGEAERAAQSVASVLERIELAPDVDVSAVEALVEDRARYREQKDAAQQAQAVAGDALRRLRAHPAFAAEMESVGAEQADAEATEARAAAERFEALTEEIAGVEAAVRAAQQGRDVEEASARLETALDDLEVMRDRVAARRVGSVLADHVARTARERQVPAVVRRAGEILETITAHRYTLTFDPATSGFVAQDRERDRGVPLDELSSGTRVQVLLSVRLAFVEQYELGARLPLVLDELLANSDEARAAAIAEAVFRLSRDGRQVFYLTSQPDEVVKWERLASTYGDVPFALVALGPGRKEVPPEAVPQIATSVPPGPEGYTAEAYGARIAVPAWSGYDDPGALHLWFVLPDPHALHPLLGASISKLGPARAAVEGGAGPALRLSDRDAVRVRLYYEALQAWREAWQQGRGRRILRTTLEACPAITDIFLDRVTEYAESLGGDAAALVSGLREGGVSRFHSKNVDLLEAYLQEHGYLSEEQVLSAEERWARVIERVGDACSREEVPLSEVRAFLDRVAAGPPAHTPSGAAA